MSDPSPTWPEGRACAVCGRILAQVRIQGRHAYTHAPTDPADHPPVAIRPDEAPQQVRMKCDFCHEEPVTHTMVVDRETSLPSAGVAYDMEWAMCATCTDLALASDWLSLRRRVFKKYERAYGPLHEDIKMEWRLLLRELRAGLVMFYQEP